MANNQDFIVKNAVEVGKDTKVTLGTIASSNIDLSTGNYFSDTLAANTTYTISNAGDVQSFQLEVTGGLGSGYDIANAIYDSVSLSISSQDTTARGIAFKPDGTKMYITGTDSDNVHQYTLSTAFDLSTASYDSVSFSVASQDTAPLSVQFNDDGTKMYVLGQVNKTVFQYTLSTAWDVSTASYASKSFSVASQATSPYGITFNDDGTSLYATGIGTDSIYQYTLSTAYDVSTASYASKSFSFASQEAVPSETVFNSTGTKMYMVGQNGDAVFQYSLSTAYDVSTASYDSVSFSVSGQADSPSSLSFNQEGSKLYVLDAGSDFVYQYSTAATATLTWPTSIEWAGGVAPAAPANGETDLFTISTDDSGTTYVGVKTADNLS